MLLIAFSDRGHAMEGTRAGADDYLSRQLDVNDLQLRLIAAAREQLVQFLLSHQENDATVTALASPKRAA